MSDVVVVIVNYRTAALTVQCVESVLASVGVQLRVLVIDNASGDSSAATIRARFADDDRVSVHARAVNDGYTGGNNAGLSIARALGTAWAVILNSDTELATDCLQHLLAARDDTIALLTPRIFFGDDRTRLWFGGGRYSPWCGRPVHVGFRGPAESGWTTPRDLPFASGCALLVRLDAIGEWPFDASLFAYAEDLDLSLRVRAAGWRIRYVPDAIVWHHEGSSHRRAGGQSLRWYLTTRNLLRVVGRHTPWHAWPVVAPMLALNVVARFAAVAVRERDWRSLGAVLRGAWHAVRGDVSLPIPTSPRPRRRSARRGVAA